MDKVIKDVAIYGGAGLTALLLAIVAAGMVKGGYKELSGQNETAPTPDELGKWALREANRAEYNNITR